MFAIEAHTIGAGRCFVIAEVAQGHGGNIDLAHEFVDAIAEAGADAVKFQTHIAEAESTLDEPFRVRGDWPASSRYEYWKLMEFSESQWQRLAARARERRLTFLSSPFSLEAANLLQRTKVPAWKIASGELVNPPLLEYLATTGLPVLLSTGLAELDEIDSAVEFFKSRNIPIVVLQTTSMYPCPAEKIGLNLLAMFRDRYHCPVGLSDHSGTIYPGLAAVALGTDVLEVHVTLNREMTGPDVTSSVTPAELRHLVDGIRFIESMRAHPVDKNEAAQDAAPFRALFTRSIAARVDLPAGSVLAQEHLAFRKPGTGIAPSRQPLVIGRRLKRAVRAHTLVREEDLE